jgi:hypothetical protein
MSAEVITLRETSLRDVPGMMRRLADDIEKGELGNVTQAIMVIPCDVGKNEYPAIFAWGDGSTSDTIMELELAKLFLLMNSVNRK